MTKSRNLASVILIIFKKKRGFAHVFATKKECWHFVYLYKCVDKINAIYIKVRLIFLHCNPMNLRKHWLAGFTKRLKPRSPLIEKKYVQ